MNLGLDGKVALVSGGSSGLGLAIARELAAEGAHVALGARDPERLAVAERSVKEVARARVHATSVDIRDPAAVRGWVDEVAADFGGLHVVVVNGAGPPVGSAAAFGRADYQAAVDTVLLPAIDLALAAVPHLTAAGWGRLLFVTSETAAVPVAPLALSGVTRAAIVRFAQSLAVDVGPAGVTVNVLAPGTTRTPPVERAAARLAGPGEDPEARLAAMGHHCALRRVADPAEVAAVAAFLAGERASFVTGTVQLVDGGAAVAPPPLAHLTAVAKETFT